jgi:hypothetical protein
VRNAHSSNGSQLDHGLDDVKGYDTTNGSTRRCNEPSTRDSDVRRFTPRTIFHSDIAVSITPSSSRLYERQAVYLLSKLTSPKPFSRSSVRIRYGESPPTHTAQIIHQAVLPAVKPRSLLWMVPLLGGAATSVAVLGSPLTTAEFTR